MMQKTITVALVCLFAGIGRVSAQNEAGSASEKLAFAIRSIDQGLYDQGIALLDEADAMDPTPTSIYSYEKAYAYYAQGEYSAAIRMIRESLKFDDATDMVYQMLGNAYDMSGNSRKALTIYARGREQFPNSGKLYREAGVIHFNRGEYDQALSFFMAGTEAEPRYPSNWFGAAELLFGSDSKALAMICGETAIGLEPNSERARNTGQQLLDAYRNNIAFPDDTTTILDFSNNTITFGGDVLDFKIPFPIVYELVLAQALGPVRTLDIPSLIEIRRRFVELWFAGDAGYDRMYPVALFDFHRALMDAEHFEAYNYWLFSFADRTAFDRWHLHNAESVDAFVEWFNRNSLFAP
jgi:tetratricopeptide (TPR) repeat protein